ncbi:MAG: glycosyltransferase family 2 protein [Gemmatimonadaceae bacterium]|nr:glycosyltransferase family 2 protein [Gemmatimonadaceae bacterium]
MSGARPTFGVVVLNWNNADDTIACLESLASARPRPAHVVVVDNASNDDSIARMKHWGEERGMLGDSPASSWLTVTEMDTNRGFAGGNNVGIRYFESRTPVSHVLLLNNDATVGPEFFDDISRALDRAPDAGLITGTILEDPARDKVWYAGAVEYPMRALVQHRFEVPDSEEPVPTDFVTGCAMVISRRLLARIGPLAECYFPLYWEDGEYSFRARNAGFPVLYAPAAKVYHKVGATVGAANVSPVVAHCQNRLRVFYVRRNYRGWMKTIALSYLAFTKPGRAAIEALKGRPRIGWAILSGTISGFLSPAARR